MLDNRCAAFYPIAGVDIFNAVHLLDGRMMDVAADNTIDADALRFF
jgi:hypothetical protein